MPAGQPCEGVGEGFVVEVATVLDTALDGPTIEEGAAVLFGETCEDEAASEDALFPKVELIEVGWSVLVLLEEV